MQLTDFNDNIYDYYVYNQNNRNNIKGAFMITEDAYIFRAKLSIDANTHTDISDYLEYQFVPYGDKELIDMYRKTSVYGYTDKGLLHIALPVNKEINSYQKNKVLDICNQVCNYNAEHNDKIKIAITSASEYKEYIPVYVDEIEKNIEKVKKIS